MQSFEDRESNLSISKKNKQALHETAKKDYKENKKQKDPDWWSNRLETPIKNKIIAYHA